VGAGVTADVGGVGVMLQVSGAQGKSASRPTSQTPSRAQSPDKEHFDEPTVRQR